MWPQNLYTSFAVYQCEAPKEFCNMSDEKLNAHLIVAHYAKWIVLFFLLLGFCLLEFPCGAADWGSSIGTAVARVTAMVQFWFLALRLQHALVASKKKTNVFGFQQFMLPLYLFLYLLSVVFADYVALIFILIFIVCGICWLSYMCRLIFSWIQKIFSLYVFKYFSPPLLLSSLWSIHCVCCHVYWYTTLFWETILNFYCSSDLIIPFDLYQGYYFLF